MMELTGIALYPSSQSFHSQCSLFHFADFLVNSADAIKAKKEIDKKSEYYVI